MSKDYDENSNMSEEQEKESPTEDRQNEDSKKTVNPQVVISFIVLFIFAVFAIVNTQEVSINFIFADVNIPLIIVVLGSFILGAITTVLTNWRKRRKKTKS